MTTPAAHGMDHSRALVLDTRALSSLIKHASSLYPGYSFFITLSSGLVGLPFHRSIRQSSRDSYHVLFCGVLVSPRLGLGSWYRPVWVWLWVWPSLGSSLVSSTLVLVSCLCCTVESPTLAPGRLGMTCRMSQMARDSIDFCVTSVERQKSEQCRATTRRHPASHAACCAVQSCFCMTS